jgi:hypothetical protein
MYRTACLSKILGISSEFLRITGVIGLFPSFGILKTRKHNLSYTVAGSQYAFLHSINYCAYVNPEEREATKYSKL